MQNYIIRFIVNGVLNEKCIDGTTKKDALRKIECIYGGQKVKIFSCELVK
jgi:hypothetical protein